ncbi:MAG: hypothetical protein ABID63_18290 [Pseudomonadota bacterium]
MIRRDLHSNIKAVSHYVGAPTATVTPSNGIDLAGFSSSEFLIHVGTVTNIANSPQPSWAFKLQESDSVSSDFTDVTNANDVLVGSAKSPVAAPNASTGVFLTIDAAAEDDQLYRVGYIGTKRYVRVVATAANTPGATPIAISAILGYPALAPTAD